MEDDPSGDSKAVGDPYCTLFVGRLSNLTTEDTLRDVRVCVRFVSMTSSFGISLCLIVFRHCVSSLQAMSKYGRIKSLRLVRHIGKVFAFVLAYDITLLYL